MFHSGTHCDIFKCFPNILNVHPNILVPYAQSPMVVSSLMRKSNDAYQCSRHLVKVCDILYVKYKVHPIHLLIAL